MSAGCVCFDEYFGESMLSSLGRIVTGKHVFGNFQYMTPHSNFHSSYHRDFSTLFSRLTEQREDKQDARRITGLDNNHVYFVRLYQ
ncbi:MAG: hypothetical protein ACK55Z_08390, partial [bacterium]